MPSRTVLNKSIREHLHLPLDNHIGEWRTRYAQETVVHITVSWANISCSAGHRPSTRIAPCISCSEERLAVDDDAFATWNSVDGLLYVIRAAPISTYVLDSVDSTLIDVQQHRWLYIIIIVIESTRTRGVLYLLRLGFETIRNTLDIGNLYAH